MKSSPGKWRRFARPLGLAAMLSGAVFHGGALPAATFTWNDSSSSWASPASWSPTGGPPGAGDIAAFASVGAIQFQPMLTDPRSVMGLAIDNSGGGVYSIGGSSNLGIGSSGLAVTGTGTTTLGTSQIILSSGQSWDVSAAATVRVNGLLTGTGTLNKAGAGLLELASDNSGGSLTALNVAAGTLRVMGSLNGLGSSTTRVTLDNNGILQATGVPSSSQVAQLRIGTGGGSVDVAAGTTLTLSGPLGGVGSLTKTSGGMLTLDNAGNTFAGGLTVSTGTVALSGTINVAQSALRSAAVQLGSSGSLVYAGATNASVRVGELSGSGVVDALQGSTLSGFYQTLLADATSSAQITTGPGAMGGWTVTGVGTQALTGNTAALNGTLTVYGVRQPSGDTSAGLTLGGSAGLVASIVNMALRGGTVTFDNTSGNADRFRDAGIISSMGGTLALMGNAASGSSESVGDLRLQAGATTIQVTHNAGTSFATTLRFRSLTSSGLPTTGTINFTNTNGILGAGGNNPTVLFSMTAPGTTSGVLARTSGSSELGFATVNGTDFAGYDSTNGIVAISTTAFPVSSSPTANALLAGSATTNGSNASFSLNTLTIDPSAANQNLHIDGGGPLDVVAILYRGTRTDFEIKASNGGAISGNATRIIHVPDAAAVLTISASFTGGSASGNGIIKAGDGTLVLTADNSSVTGALTLNGGALRSSLGNLPTGAVAFRGGVLEVSGGGTFSRTVSTVNGQFVNWETGATNQGSGGFAALGGTLTVSIGNATWDTTNSGFVRGGFALVFGSSRADSLVDYNSGIGLDNGTATAYTAREIRVVDNPSSPTDRARISGSITGSSYSDLLKTGAGTLELTGNNTYAGNTIVHGGTLLVNNAAGSAIGSGTVVVRAGASLGGGNSSGTAGFVGGNIHVASAGRLAPGTSTDPGILTVNNNAAVTFANGAFFDVKLNGSTAGTSYDQLVITAGSTIDLGSATLNAILGGGYTPGSGDKLYLINNQNTTGGLLGTFAGLQDGAQVTIGSYTAFISYRGEVDGATTGGNDVVLFGFQPAPEPSRALLLTAFATGAAAFLRRRLR